MAVNLNRMRKCFEFASTWNNWTAEERSEIAVEIKAALDKGDPEIIALWANWLEETSDLVRIGELCRAAEARIRADRKARAV